MLKALNIEGLHLGADRRRCLALAGPRYASRQTSRSSLILCLLMLTIFLGLPFYSAQAAIFGGYSEYYIPGPEDQIWNIQVEIDNRSGTPLYLDNTADRMHSIISITASGDNTTVYYDHWENGYGFDPNDPENTFDEKFTLQAGEFLSLENRVGNPAELVPVTARPATRAELYYDGADRFYVAGNSVAVSRTLWPGEPLVLTTFALSWEVYPIKPFLTEYTIPVGEDLAVAPKFYEDFEQTYVLVMSTEDNNQVQIDEPDGGGGYGAVDQIDTLDRGQTTNRFNIDAGTRIIAQKPVQVQFIVANSRGHFEMRGYVAVPDNLWDNEYYNPVNGDGSGGAYDTDLYIYNPNLATIIVQYEDTSGSGVFTIPSRETLAYSDAAAANRFVPSGSAVYLKSDDIFWAIGSGDTESTSMDWGFTLLPANLLTDEYYLGWAPGSNNLTLNGSPAFVTAVNDETTVNVDLDGDGANDTTVIMNRLESQTFRDLSDNDNSGMRISASGPLAVAWGIDPDVSDPFNPFLDLGAPMLPFPRDWIDVTLSIDHALTPSVVGPITGEVSTVTLTVNTDDFPVNGVSVTDLLPADWSFMPGTVTITLPGGSTITGAAADPVTYASGGQQVLEWTNSLLNGLNMAADEELIITFDIQTSSAPAIGIYEARAQAVGYRLGGSQVFTPFDSAFINVTAVTIDKDVAAGFSSVSQGGQTSYTIRVENITNSNVTQVGVEDFLPTGFTYVGSSTTFVDSDDSGGATVTRTLVIDPPNGDNSPEWGEWTLAADAWLELTFLVDVAGTVTPGTYDNRAEVTGFFGALAIDVDDKGTTAQDLGTPEGADPEDDEDVTVYLYSLEIDKERAGGQVDTISPGDTVQYLIKVFNTGNATVSNIRVTDPLPPDFTYTSTDSVLVYPGGSPLSYTLDASDTTAPIWESMSLNAGERVEILFTATVAETAGAATYDNTALAEVVGASPPYIVDDSGAVGQDTDTPAGEDPEDDEDITVTAAQLTIDKDAVTTSAVAGSTDAVYTIRVENTGGGTANLVQITDDLTGIGAGFTFASATVTVSAGVTPTDYVSLTTTPNLGDTNLTFGDWSVPAGGWVELEITVDVGVGVTAGTYDNTAGASHTAGSSTIVVDDDGLAAQDADTPDFADAEDDEDIYVYAAGDNRVDLTIDLLSISLFAWDLPNIYIAQVSNLGPGTETGTITVSNTLPAGLTYLTWPTTGDPSGWDCSVVGQDITCTNDTDLPAGQTLPDLVVTVDVDDYETDDTRSFTQGVTVAATTTEVIGGLTNNTDSEAFVAKYPDLSESTKTVEDLNGGSVEPGDVLQYTIEILNTGERAAPQVSVDDNIQLPLDRTSFEFISVPTGAASVYDDLTGDMLVSGFSVPPLQSRFIIYNVEVAASALAGQTIDNSALITNPKGLDATVDAPTLTVSAPPTPAAGNKPLYLYENQSLSRTPPPLENFVAVADGGSKTWILAPATQQAITLDGASGVISVALNLRSQDFGVHDYDVTVTLASAGDTVLTIGSVARTVGLDNPSVTTEVFNVPVAGDINLTAGSRVTVTVAQTNTNPGSPDIHVFTNYSAGAENSRVELTSKNVIDVDSVKFYDAAYPGGTELSYTSPGQTFYTRSVVSDPFGSYDITGATLSLVDSEGFVALTDATMTMVNDSGADTKTYELAYTVPGGSGASNWTATVEATEGTEGDVTATGTGTLEESPITGADLAINKSHVGNFAVGQNGEFTLRVTNFGPDDQLSAVTVTDTLPAGLTYVSSTFGAAWSTTASPGDNPVTWTRTGTLYAGDSEDIVLTVAVDSLAVPSVENVATVSLGDGENHPSNNTTRDTVYVSQLSVVKSSDAPSPYYPGEPDATDPISFTAVVTNNGLSPVVDVKVVDPLPPEYTYIPNSTDVTIRKRVFRVTEYFIDAGLFTGTTYNLLLDQDLEPNYFVIIQGSDGTGTANLGPNVNYAALTGDPFGTGELTDLVPTDQLELTRGSNAGGTAWVGVVTVVECLKPASPDGFQLRDVRRVSHPNADLSGTEGPTTWTNINQVMLMGGFNGAGCQTADPTSRDTKVCHARIWPTAPGGTPTIEWSRDAGGATLTAAESTVMVVEWGNDWTVQQVRVNVANVGGAQADQTSDYTSVALPLTVDPANTWVWGTGHTDDQGIGDASEGVLITLGDGVTVAGNAVALGMDNPDDVDFTVYALTNADIDVDHRFHPYGNTNDLLVDVTVDSATGQRMALSYNGCNGTGNAYPRPMWSARYVDNTTVRLERRRGGQQVVAWVQGINLSGLFLVETNPGNPPDDLVLDTDGYILLPGEQMTVTYQVTLTDPSDTGPVTNTVYASSAFFPDPAESSVTIDVRSIGVAEFTDINGTARTTFDYLGATGEEIYLRVYDPDKNIDPNVRESITVTVRNNDPASGDTITATLYETGPDTGDFAYTNPLANDPASNTNSGVAETIVVQLVNPETGLTEDVTLTETGPDTGIFTNTNFWIRYELLLESTPGDPDRLYVVPGSSNANLQMDYVDNAGDVSRDFSTEDAAVSTLVVLSNFEAYSDSGQVIVAWETVSEVGTLGFHLLRLDENSGGFEQVNDHLLIGLLHEPHGGVYRYLDSTAVPGSTYTYKLVEVERRGDRWTYGPFTVLVGPNERYSSLPALTSDYDRTAHAPAVAPPDPSVLRTLSESIPAAIAPGDTIKISVSNDDLYFLPKDLIASHLGKTVEEVSGLIQQGQFALTNRGLAVPYMPAPGDAGLYFYGVAESSIFTRENIYWLTQGDGVVMPTRANTGDIDGNGTSDGTDANLALQILSGVVPVGIPAGDLVWRADIDESGTVGLPEVLYLSQKAIGLRGDPVDDSGPVPSAAEGVFPSKVHFEQEYFSIEDSAIDPRADYWMWTFVVSGAPGSDVPFTIQDVDNTAGAGVAQVMVRLHSGNTLPAAVDHHAKIKINGTEIGEGFWDGIRSKILTFAFDAALFNEGTNSLTVTGVPDSGFTPPSVIYLDAFDVTYPRYYRATNSKLAVSGDGNTVISIRGFDDPAVYVFDIADSFKTRRVTAIKVDNPDGKNRISFSPKTGMTKYLALNLSSAQALTQAELQVDTPANLKSTSIASEYLLIVPFAFADNAAIEQLVDHRRSQDLTARVVVLEDIMDEFNDGVFDPEAIREFLVYAWNNWAIPPRYVVLVGDGTNDFRAGYGAGDNRMPPMLVNTPDGLRASDNRFADLDGDDGVPEMAIGRLPVADTTELQTVIGKIIAYEKQPRADWQKRVLMLADNADGSSGNNFPADSDAVATLVPNTYSISKNYLNNPPGTSITVSRAALFNDIDTGALLLNYLGHGGYFNLAQEGLLVHSDDSGDVATKMINGTRLPIASLFSCVQGRFELPGYDSLSESLLKQAGGGAAAVWASGGRSVNHRARILSAEFFKAVFNDQKDRVGDAVRLALQRYQQQTGDRLLPKGYNFFGDPAMRMPLTKAALN